MNDKKKENSGKQSDIELDDLNNLEDELNNLSDDVGNNRYESRSDYSTEMSVSMTVVLLNLMKDQILV
jgi:hypothetical protein